MEELMRNATWSWMNECRSTGMVVSSASNVDAFTRMTY